MAISCGIGAVLFGLAVWRAYTWGRLVGFSNGWEVGERDGFRAGFARGVVVTTHAWQTAGDESALLVDLSEDVRERN
jgi:hypothetical protein